MGLERREIFPLLHDDDLVRANFGLIGKIGFCVNRWAIFDAARFGTDIGDEFAEYRQLRFFCARDKFDGGDNMNHIILSLWLSMCFRGC